MQWTIELKRDADYWEETVTVKDSSGALVPFDDAQITIHPDAGNDVLWSVDNGKLLIVSDGVFGFDVPLTEIQAYPFSSATFCWSVTYTNGKIDGSWMTGAVTVKDACL